MPILNRSNTLNDMVVLRFLVMRIDADRSFPRSRVGMQPVTLCVTKPTPSVLRGIPTQSVGTIIVVVI
ncbi:hypothetical protein D3C84_622830 [compost metagenome]